MNKQMPQTNRQPKKTKKSALTNQVVFHWPANMDANTKVRSVGLIEAVVRWLIEHLNVLLLFFGPVLEHFNCLNAPGAFQGLGKRSARSLQSPCTTLNQGRFGDR